MKEDKEWKKIEKSLQDLHERRNDSFVPVPLATILAILAVFAVCFLVAVKVVFLLVNLF